MSELIVIHFDGAASPNPGKASYGWVMRGSAGKTVKRFGVLEGDRRTNNEAEYAALVHAMTHLVRVVIPHPARPKAVAVEVRGDSRLVVEQVNGRWECKSPGLKAMHEKAQRLMVRAHMAGVPVTLKWIPREQNAEADELSKLGWEKTNGRPMPEFRR